LDPYRRESLKILAIFKEMVPKGEIGKLVLAFPREVANEEEKASIDEAFLDLTPMVIDRLLEIHPYLAAQPVDAPDGLDSPLPRAPPIDWTKAGEVFPTNGEGSEPVAEVEGEEQGEGEMYSSQQSNEEGRGPAGESRGRRDDDVTWEDWALCLGAEIMAEIRGEVWKRLHYTCSAVSSRRSFGIHS
jgi:DNA polymerase eta